MPGDPFHSHVPVGAPTITCISANKYVLQSDNTLRYVSSTIIYNGSSRLDSGDIDDLENGWPPTSSKATKNDNPKSLGFLVKFNHFRYYVAGDLERDQEDGTDNRNNPARPFQPGVRARINQDNNMAGRVLVMKTSHHGAETASSRIFINQLRPSAAIISASSPNRKYGHPSQRVLNILDGYPDPFVLPGRTDGKHPDSPPPPPQRSVYYYLTGYSDPYTRPPTGKVGSAGQIAGNPSPLRAPGHIKLTVSEEQSQRSCEGQIYRGVKAATSHTARAIGLNLPPDKIEKISDKGAVHGVAAAVATVVDASEIAMVRALDATAYVGPDTANYGVIPTASREVSQGGNAASVSAAAVDLVLRERVEQIGQGVDAALGEAMTGSSAAAICNAAVGAGATWVAGNAAGYAARTVYDTIPDPTNMGTKSEAAG